MKNILVILLLASFVNASIPVMIINKNSPSSLGYCENKNECKYFPKKDILPYGILFLSLIILTFYITKIIFKAVILTDDYNKIVRK